MSNTYTKIDATIKEFLTCYQTAFRTKDATALSKTLTSDCLRAMQPKIFAETLQLQKNPIAVADYEKIVQSELPALEVGQIDLEKQVIDTEKKTAALKVNIHADLKDGTQDILEFVFMLDLTENCDQITAAVQFADTAKINGIVAQIKDIVSRQ